MQQRPDERSATRWRQQRRANANPPPNTPLCIFPSVSVPVLSSQIIPGLSSFSNTSPDLTRIPFLASRPMATAIARGVASYAHGQATTSNATMRSTATVGSITNHIATVASESTRTTTTKRAAMRLAHSTTLTRFRRLLNKPGDSRNTCLRVRLTGPDPGENHRYFWCRQKRSHPRFSPAVRIHRKATVHQRTIALFLRFHQRVTNLPAVLRSSRLEAATQPKQPLPGRH